MTKSYRQYCGLARALDHVGDRWTLLMVRELLMGARSYKALSEALPGLADNLLTQRLAHLEADGLTARSSNPTRSKSVSYQLTAAGRALEPAIFELIRWGGMWMTSGPGEDAVRPEWLILALRALLEDRDVTMPQGRVLVVVPGHSLTVGIGPEGRWVRPDASFDEPALAVIRGGFDQILGLAAGHLDVHSPQLSIEGDSSLVGKIFTPWRGLKPDPVRAPLVGDLPRPAIPPLGGS